ncbi:Abi family protein [Companilactobacillus suantsaicola]|uniref:Abi family protein n=1 Tax=Companilactobacillus suantsaicola TaxID=2487723 RepID=UPI00319E89C3
MKQTIFRAILNVEHHLKSIFAYRFAEAYPNKCYSYLDINCYSSDKALDVGYIISKLSMIINKHKRYPNNAINHYVKKYNDVPIWVIIDFLDFGELVSLINCVPRSLQNKIAKDLVSFIKDNVPDFNKQFTPETMISLIKNIRETRNVCAHNNRLLDFRCRSDSIFFPAIHGSSGIHKDEMRRELYSTFVSMQCFLSKTEFAILNNTLRKKFRHLANKIKSIDINNILDSLGFPHDWYQKEKILQF